MLREVIDYTDFEGRPQKDVFYFNLTEMEVIRMEAIPDAGLEALLNRIIESKSVAEMMVFMEDIVLGSVGIKSEDGKSFIKEYPDGRKVRDEFKQHAAYNALMLKMFQDDRYAVTWMAGTFPSQLTPEKIEDVNKDARGRVEELTGLKLGEPAGQAPTENTAPPLPPTS